MKRPAFWFDASACSGCKACQVACKDKHDLPDGVLWRRVYEVAGGGWERRGDAWVHDVAAYNVSMACNHCERPICLEVCPTRAIHRREDGLVLIDRDRCMGCRYCEWACPYGAPQFDRAAGRMTKCTFCVDELDAGRPPACVAACPMRVLDFDERDGLDARHGPAPAIHPLPPASLTEPALALTPHPSAGPAAGTQAADPAAGPAASPAADPVADPAASPAAVPTPPERSLRRPVRVANAEEVRPGAEPLRESSLVAFTLLAQTAVGLVWAALLAWLVAGADAGGGTGWLLAPLLPAGPLMAAALLVSMLHLGTPRNAWRAISGLRSSWLSREIALAGLFGAGWLVLAGLAWAAAVGRAGGAALLVATVVEAGIGAALVHAMARVYRLRTVPGWDSPLTTTRFFLTAVTLGAIAGAASIAALPIAAAGGGLVGLRALAGLAFLGLAGQLLVEPLWQQHRDRAVARLDPGLRGGAAEREPPLRLPLLLLALLAAVALTLSTVPGFEGLRAPAVAGAVVTAGAAAVVGRAAFYAEYGRLGV